MPRDGSNPTGMPPIRQPRLGGLGRHRVASSRRHASSARGLRIREGPVTRAQRIDTWIVVGLTPVWLVCAFLHLRLVIDDRLTWIPLHVAPAEAADRGPVVIDFWPGVEPSEVGLERGDELLAAGTASLRGADRPTFLLRLYDEAREGEIEVLVRGPDGREVRKSMQLRPVVFAWRTVPVVLVSGALGLILLRRGRRARAARAWALTGLAYSFHWSLLFAYPGWQSLVGLPLFLGGAALFPPLALRACLLTPDAIARPSRLALAAPWLLLVNGPATASWLLGTPASGEAGLRVIFAVNAVLALGAAYAITHNYRRADATGRRQLKWVILGVLVLALPVFFTAVVAALDPTLWWLYEMSLLFTAATPLCIFLAFVRDRFLDIDRLLSTTATYSVLSVVGLALLFSVIPYLSQWVSAGTRIGQGEVQTLLSVVVAAILIPSERVFRPPIERWIYRERRALEEGLRDLRVRLARTDDPGTLFELLGERLAAILRLDTCAVYAPRGDALVPTFSKGAGLPTGFATDGRLVQLVAAEGRPVPIARWRRWARRGHVDPAEAASLEALGATVLVPIEREDELAALLCLGEKESGDIFTEGDLQLLASVADRVSFALLRFDQADMEKAERERKEALQSYVPGAVVEHLESGGSFADGAREVTVLFVDIRGYTGFAEGRSPTEIFEVVNAYTRAVSGVVREHGGAVVDFQGDGLFAVFGAPEVLARKEQAAVDAAHAILETVSALRLGADETRAPLEAGIGIATGEAYVGNIQAVDRMIWGVIGNTTNLAARLQGLTRELDAAIVIDDVTREACSADLRGFERRSDVRVKGRSEGFQLWARPRTRPAPGSGP